MERIWRNLHTRAVNPSISVAHTQMMRMPRLECPVVGLHTLVVEDVVEYRILVACLCQKIGETDYKMAASGGEARELLSKSSRPFDLVLLNYNLWDGEGLRLLSEIRSNPLYVHTPVVMVSASNDLRTRARAFEAGAQDYVAKPLNLTKLSLIFRRAKQALLEPNMGLAPWSPID